MYNKDQLSNFYIDGYNLYIYQRVQRQGGGVVIYAKDHLVIEEVTSIKEGLEVESLWVDIGGKNISVRIGLFYRPPNNLDYIYIPCN